MSLTRRSLFGTIGAAVTLPGAYEFAFAKANSGEGVAGLRVPAGHLVVVGRDMVNDKSSERMVAWNDAMSGEWEPTSQNLAGSWLSPYSLAGPAQLDREGRILIPCACGTWRMTYIGPPFVYSFELMNVSAQPMEAL